MTMWNRGANPDWQKEEEEVGYDQVFPEPLGSTKKTTRPLPGTLRRDSAASQGQGSASPRGGSWRSGGSGSLGGNPGALLLGLGLCLGMMAALAALIACIVALVQQSSRAFCSLAASSGFPNCWIIALFLVIFLVLVLLALCAGCLLPFFPEKRGAIAGWAVCILILAALLAILALLGLIGAWLAQSSVSRAANEICASYDKGAIPGCSKATGSATGTAQGAPAPAAPAPATASAPLTRLLGTPTGDALATELPAARRRLDSAHDAAAAYVSDSSVECADTQELCRASSNWNPATSCACSGSSAIIGGTTKGAYCDSWGDGDSWCFVEAGVTCGPPTVYSGLNRSPGPCGNDVESRSQLVLDGKLLVLLAMGLTLLAAALLAIASCCGCFLSTQRPASGAGRGYRTAVSPYESRLDRGGQDDRAPLMSTKRASSPGETNIQGMSLEEQFRWAQEQAYQYVDDDTPKDKRMELYGYYHQAVHGNCTGGRPDFLHGADQSQFDAWRRLEGVPRNEAMRRYVQAVQRIVVDVEDDPDGTGAGRGPTRTAYGDRAFYSRPRAGASQMSTVPPPPRRR